MKFAWRNFRRNRRVTAAAAAAVLALTFFLLAFSNSIRMSEATLDATYDRVTVSAHVAGRDAVQLPRIPEQLYQDILASGFVSSSYAMAQQQVNQSFLLRGLDHVTADPALAEYAPYIQWSAGYDPETFGGETAVCVAPRSAGYQLGDVFLTPIGVSTGIQKELTVVGLYGYELSETANVFYCPLETLRVAFTENNLSFFYCGLEMDLRNLRELDRFKAEMRELGMETGTARMVVNDSILREVTAQLKQHVRLLHTLFPIFLLLVAGIGFGLSFLLLRGRRREAAVMRSLGTKRQRVFTVLLLETAMQAACGALLGTACALAVLGMKAVQPGALALLLCCYLLGGAVAVFRLSAVNVFTIMTTKE